MRSLIPALLIITVFLTGCATKKEPIPAPPTTAQNASIALSEAANSVNRSLIQLNATDQAANPPQNIAEPPSPATYGMDIPASLDWNGPVEPVVAELAKISNYQFKVFGTPPGIPLIVYVSQQNTNVGDLLRNIGLQCKNQASVVVYPKNRVIELRYIN